MEKVNITINGMQMQVPANDTILQAAHDAGIRIPTLCYLKDINAIAACRMCLVEVKGARSQQRRDRERRDAERAEAGASDAAQD